MKSRSLIILAVAAISGLSGCARIQSGSVGILQHWDGQISEDTAQAGFHTALFDSYIEIDTTQTRAEVKNLTPKDGNGVALKDVDVVVTYSLDPDLVAKFYRKTKELDPEPNSNLHTLGLQIMEKSVIPNVVQEATEKSSLTDIAKNLGVYQNTIQKGVDARLNALYPGINPFKIQSVSILNFTLPESIQEQVNARAGYQAALKTIASQMEVIEKRKVLLQEQATVSANALAQAAKSTGLSPDQVIAWQKAQAYSEMASHLKLGSALVNIPTP